MRWMATSPSPPILWATTPFWTSRADGSAFWALGETVSPWPGPTGSAAVHYDYAGRYLKDYALDGDGFSALLLGKYRAGSGAGAGHMGADGQELASLDLEDQSAGPGRLRPLWRCSRRAHPLYQRSSAL